METNTFRIIIYEDDDHDAEMTASLLKEWLLGHELKPVFVRHEDAVLNPAELEHADLVILDMEMKEASGIELGKRMHRLFPDLTILITSAHNAYLEKGYVLRAARYFLKPLNPKLVFLELDDLFEEPAFAQRKAIAGIRMSRIEWIEYLDRKCVFTLTNGTQLTRSIPLAQAAKETAGCGFACPHKGILANLQYVESTGKTEVLMRSQNRLPLSRRNRKQFEEEFEKWIY